MKESNELNSNKIDNNPLDISNNIINPYQSQYIPKNNGQNNNNFNPTQKSTVIPLKKTHHKKKHLKVNLT